MITHKMKINPPKLHSYLSGRQKALVINTTKFDVQTGDLICLWCELPQPTVGAKDEGGYLIPNAEAEIAGPMKVTANVESAQTGQMKVESSEIMKHMKMEDIQKQVKKFLPPTEEKHFKITHVLRGVVGLGAEFAVVSIKRFKKKGENE